jgi:hypothetical protein
VELQVFINFNTNSYANQSKNGSGAPRPFLYQFQYKFICKSMKNIEKHYKTNGKTGFL